MQKFMKFLLKFWRNSDTDEGAAEGAVVGAGEGAGEGAAEGAEVGVGLGADLPSDPRRGRDAIHAWTFPAIVKILSKFRQILAKFS